MTVAAAPVYLQSSRSAVQLMTPEAIPYRDAVLTFYRAHAKGFLPLCFMFAHRIEMGFYARC